MDSTIEETKSDPASEEKSAEATEGAEAPMRTLIAIGDLHGDYYRLVRLMRESDLLLPGTYAWNPQQNQVDLILIGDYVDWRNEPLEGPDDEWPRGSRKILELLYALHRELEQLRLTVPGFKSNLYTILGNHDEMMLEAHQIFSFLEVERLDEFLTNMGHSIQVKHAIQALGLGPGQVERVLKFLNWYVQGGQATIQGYEGLARWKEEMDGEMGAFLRQYLRLGVVVNNRLFAHTVPDYREFWRPIEEIVALPESGYRRAKEAFLWSRKVWGFDYCTGSRTAPFSSEEIDEMLMGMAVEGLVVGHTPLPHDGKPVIAHGGRVINIDLHAYPGSEALIQTYQPTENASSAPLRDVSLGR
ncbi:metallophosphoesterase [bacterium]|nr:metallophosphoesterase [bacterium]